MRYNTAMTAICFEVLVGALHPVPVVVQSMPPEQISSLPGPDAWTILGVVLSFAAAVAAIVAAAASIKAVRIANKSYALAKAELKVVSDEFAELTRRPDVRVDGRIQNQTVYYQGRTRAGFVVTVEVINSGKRLARSVIAELLIPQSVRAATDPASWGGPSNFRVAVLSKEGEPYHVFTIDLPDLHPNGVQVSSSFPPATLLNDVPECRLLLRVYDENFGYPEEEPQWLTYRSEHLNDAAGM